MKDHYQVLQVRRDASPEVIAAAYRRLMKDAHPDAGGDTARARRLNAAYEVLSDVAARQRYDLTLAAEHVRERPLPVELAFRTGRVIGRLRRSFSSGGGKN